MDNQFWQNKLNALDKYVERSEFTVVHYYKNGQLIATVKGNGKITFHDLYQGSNMSLEDLEIYATNKENVVDTLALAVARRQAIDKYVNFWEEFKIEFFSKFGILGNDKAESFLEVLRKKHGNDIAAINSSAQKLVSVIKS